ncbi:hypothetical protein [Desulfovibrio legallii]|jgi:hypothetical protein|uniref:Tetratricopeptide repeat-like domain-containing protein n=1 Tax=Desulfovibrio legallii TaxID=571438 RepID=A0A1G7M4V4_9BACT|nr:hypothetical protein [Desulfovibrio legallii]SDF56802.1 hypothetical protein SAMN05192586_1083 [Desulfovibrio legallii]
MNPQKNQGAPDSPLLRDLQSEVSAESAPLLQFMLRHAGVIAGVVVLFLLVLGGTGVWRWYHTSRGEASREDLARIALLQSGADQMAALQKLAEEAHGSVRFAVRMTLGESALAANQPEVAAQAYAAAALDDPRGALGLAAGLNEAGALLRQDKAAEALTLLQKLQSGLPGEVRAPQLRQMLAEVAAAAGQPREAAKVYLALARETQGTGGGYFRARAERLAPDVVREEADAAEAAKAAPAEAQKAQ